MLVPIIAKAKFLQHRMKKVQSIIRENAISAKVALGLLLLILRKIRMNGQMGKLEK